MIKPALASCFLAKYLQIQHKHPLGDFGVQRSMNEEDEVMKFSIQIVKGQLYSDIIMHQEQKGKLQP